MAASVEAIFLSTSVLISPNRAQTATDKRDDLDLHISLLAEHELTRLMEMVAAIAQKLKVRTGAEQGNRRDHEGRGPRSCAEGDRAQELEG
jgi:uncharacterized membrane protein